MEIEYKKLTVNELDTFIEMRISQLREEGAKEEIDLVPYLKEYYKKHMGVKLYTAYGFVHNDNYMQYKL